MDSPIASRCFFNGGIHFLKRILLPALIAGTLACTTVSGTGYAAPKPVLPATPTPHFSAPKPAPQLAAPKDSTAPGPVTNLQLTANTVSSVSLGWLNPSDADLAHLLIRRAAGSTAPAAGQGSLVATLGATKTTVTDTGLAAASTYSYAVFATDKAGNQSPAATITVSTAATDARTGLRGTLTDAQGHGIGNVLVHVRLGTVDAADAVTSSAGTYSVTNLVAGSYSVCFEPKSNVAGRSLAGYLARCYHQQPYSTYSQATPVTVSAGSLTSRVDETLAVSGAVTGRITNPVGSPVAGVLISTTSYGAGTQYFTAISAADGSYTVKNLPPNGGYTFCYDTSQATGYLSDCDYGNAVYPVAGQLVTLNHSLDVGGVVTGVVRAPSGTPVAGVPVQNWTLGGEPAVTDATGRYRITGLRSGSYYLCPDGSSVPPSTAAPYGYLNSCGYYPNLSVDVQVNQTVTQDFTLSRYGALGGTLSQSDGTPAAGAWVQLFTSDGYSAGFPEADAQGHWQQRVLPGRQYYACYLLYDSTDVWTCHRGQPWTGGQPTGELIPVTEGALTTVNDTLLPGATITGTVTDPDGAALADAVVSVDDLAGFQHVQAITDADGHYSVTGLPAGSYRVCFGAAAPASSPGYPFQCYRATAEDRYPYALQLAPGQHAVIDYRLTPGTGISGRVTDADGNPVQSVAVRLADSAGASVGQPAFTDGDGNYSFDQLFPGDYTVCFDPQYVYPQPATGYVSSCWHDQPPTRPGNPVHAVAGTVSGGIDATLATGGQITGTVTDSAGNPVTGITVQALYADGTVVSTGYSYWPDGDYQLTGLPGIPVAVCVVPAEWQPYQPGCYAHATDYSTATMVTAGTGATVSGIDLQLADSTAAAASVNRPAAGRAVQRQG